MVLREARDRYRSYAAGHASLATPAQHAPLPSRSRRIPRQWTTGLRRSLNHGASATLSHTLAALETACRAAPENTRENSMLGEVSPAAVLGQGRLSRTDASTNFAPFRHLDDIHSIPSWRTRRIDSQPVN